MRNPWLDVPLADYEGHMSSAAVQQLGALSDLFAEALAHCRPRSVAILGLAGGNGLDRIDSSVTRRVVGVDINPLYLEAARRRFGDRLDLQLSCLDLAKAAVALEPVGLVHAALVFEHAGAGRCLENAISMVAPGGALSAVLQLSSREAPDVGPSPYASIQRLAPHFSLIGPGWFTTRVAGEGFRLDRESRRVLPGGKEFWMGFFRREPDGIPGAGAQ